MFYCASLNFFELYEEKDQIYIRRSDYQNVIRELQYLEGLFKKSLKDIVKETEKKQDYLREVSWGDSYEYFQM